MLLRLNLVTFLKFFYLKKLLTFFSVLAFFAAGDLSAQTLRRPVSSAYTGLGAYSNQHIDVFSFTSNQAALAGLQSSAIGVFGERRFLLDELNNFSAAVGLVTKSGNIGVKGNYFGSSDYNETQLGLAYARKLGQKLDVGVQFNYSALRIPTYGSASTISFEAGAIMHVTDKLLAGIHVSNPVGGKYGKNEEEKLSSLYAFGIGYDASEKFMISATIEKEEDQPVNVNAGFQYKFIKQLLVRAGFSSATSSYWAGVGLSLQSFRLDLTSSFHPQLGVTPGLMIIYQFNAKKD